MARNLEILAGKKQRDRVMQVRQTDGGCQTQATLRLVTQIQTDGGRGGRMAVLGNISRLWATRRRRRRRMIDGDVVLIRGEAEVMMEDAAATASDATATFKRRDGDV